MRESPNVILTVPLELPLVLVNEIEEEARLACVSIPELLARHLVEAMTERVNASTIAHVPSTNEALTLSDHGALPFDADPAIVPQRR